MGGIGRRIANLICKKCDIDLNKRVAVMSSPLQFKVPAWFLNRRKDLKDGKSVHLSTNNLDGALRMDLERMKRCRHHRGLRHFWGPKVRGQHTKTTGRGRYFAMMAKMTKGGMQMEVGKKGKK